jgi:photosystem II stability/assembly factor-like uncharacterized protein
MSTDGGSVWTEIDANYYTDGMDMVLDDSTPGTVWTAGYYSNHMAVSKTVNWGSSWTRRELSTATGQARTLALDPDVSSTVYAGGYENSAAAIYRTANGGTSWTKLTASGLSGYVNDLVVDPVDTDIIYAATESGIYRSTNGGTSFTKVSGSVSATRCLLMDPGDNSVIYAATYGQGVWMTENAGSTWQELNDGLDEMKTTALALTPDTWLFCGTEGRSSLRFYLGTGTGGSTGAELGCGTLSVAPNPARGSVTVTFEDTGAADTRLAVYDISGRLVTDLVRGCGSPGTGSVVWNASEEAAPGVYFLVLTSGGENHTQRLAVVR